MRILTVLLVLAAWWQTSLSQASVADGSRPNFIIIFIDDLGYADIGPFGATRQRTPHLDRMAREGMKLTSFYAAPVCSVSRAQLLTGCYGVRVSVPGVFGPASRNGLHPEEFTIAERLKDYGYATACVGKWHVGDQPPFLPTRQGFDRYFGLPYSNDMQRPSAETGARVVPLVRDDRVVELLADDQQSRIVERYTEEALRFIGDHRDQPFVLYLPHTAVHTPIYPGARFSGKSPHGRFSDWVEEVDWSVGQILDKLTQLQLDEKTLVIFTSDNGPWLIKGSDGGSALPLRGGKGSTWEGGVRVPTLARWPGKIPAQSVCDAVAGTIDLLPTLVRLAGGDLPAEPIIDGRDISPLLLGKSQQSPREAHYYFSGYELQAVRQGPWKLAIRTQRETMGKEAASDANINPRLYHLDRDIGETSNVAADHPDLVARLEALAVKIQAEIAGDQPQARRPAGEVEQPTTLYPSQAQPARGKKGGKPKIPPTSSAVPAKPLNELKVGESLAGQAAPQVSHRPFTIACRVETSQPDAVLLAHGGSAIGYALHLDQGRVTFQLQMDGRSAKVQAAPTPFPLRLKAGLLPDGSLMLQVADLPAIHQPGIGLLKRQPQEEFCLGHDGGRPVIPAARNIPFRGELSELSLTTP